VCVCVLTATTTVSIWISVGFLELRHSAYKQNDIIASFDHATAEKLLRPSPAVSLHPRASLVCAQCLAIQIIPRRLDPGIVFIPNTIILLRTCRACDLWQSKSLRLFTTSTFRIESRIVFPTCVPHRPRRVR